MEQRTVALCAMCFVASLQAAAMDFNFNEDAVGKAPASASASSAGGNTVLQIVDKNSSPADVFGGSGNRSLLIEDKNNSAICSAVWNTENFVTETGVMTFRAKLFIPRDSQFNDPALHLVLGYADSQGHNAPGQAVSLSIMKNGFYIYNGTADNGFTAQKPGERKFPYGSTWDIVISIDSYAGKWTATVNGESLTRSGNSEFAFRETVTGINTLRIATTRANAATRVFIDDIKLESGTGK